MNLRNNVLANCLGFSMLNSLLFHEADLLINNTDTLVAFTFIKRNIHLARNLTTVSLPHRIKWIVNRFLYGLAAGIYQLVIWT